MALRGRWILEVRCDCGLYPEDPLHDPYHRIKEHNDYAFARQKAVREKEFDKLLEQRGRSGVKGRAVSGVPGSEGSLWA